MWKTYQSCENNYCVNHDTLTDCVSFVVRMYGINVIKY